MWAKQEKQFFMKGQWIIWQHPGLGRLWSGRLAGSSLVAPAIASSQETSAKDDSSSHKKTSNDSRVVPNFVLWDVLLRDVLLWRQFGLVDRAHVGRIAQRWEVVLHFSEKNSRSFSLNLGAATFKRRMPFPGLEAYSKKLDNLSNKNFNVFK